MVKLVAKSALTELLPISDADCEMVAVAFPAITSIAPAGGSEKAVSTIMNEKLGLRFPAVNKMTENSDARCIWMGAGQAFFIGKAPRSLKGAVLTDQSDGWALIRLTGVNAQSVLARLVPIDLRLGVFKPGNTARTMLFHMPLSLTRNGAQSFDLMVFRSMAATAVHEIHDVMKNIAAR